MTKPTRERGPYKKMLSIFEIEALAQNHAGSPIFITNKAGERLLEPWLKELRFNQALNLAEQILGGTIDSLEFQRCWDRTKQPRKKHVSPAEPPNTATFGGYRLRARTALNRDKRQKPRPKKK